MVFFFSFVVPRAKTKKRFRTKFKRNGKRKRWKGRKELGRRGSGGPMRQQLYNTAPIFLAFPARPLCRQATRIVTIFFSNLTQCSTVFFFWTATPLARGTIYRKMI